MHGQFSLQPSAFSSVAIQLNTALLGESEEDLHFFKGCVAVAVAVELEVQVLRGAVRREVQTLQQQPCEHRPGQIWRDVRMRPHAGCTAYYLLLTIYHVCALLTVGRAHGAALGA
jgi:hypothetical protein